MLGSFDIAAKFYNAVAGSAEEVAKEAKEVVIEEIKQVAQGKSSLATTESLVSFAQNATNSSTAVVPYVQKLATYLVPNVSNNDMCDASTAIATVDAAKEGTSYLGYAGYGLGLLATVGGSVFGLRKLFQAKQQAEVVLSAEARPVLEQAEGFLNALDNLLKNDAVKAILKVLTGQQAAQLKALADGQPTYFADLAALDPAVQVLQLNNAIKPVVAPSLPADLTDVNLNDLVASTSSNPVMGTQAEKTASQFGALIDSIMKEPEAKQLLAIVGQHDKATQILGKMNEAALKMLAYNAPKFIANEKFTKYSDDQHVALLVGLASKVGQTIELDVAKKSTLKV